MEDQVGDFLKQLAAKPEIVLLRRCFIFSSKHPRITSFKTQMQDHAKVCVCPNLSLFL